MFFVTRSGMAMPERNFSSEKYRYGFNGKEKDKDIAVGDYDFGARIYDGRIGRWLSVDPLQAKYPGLSPYNFVANSVLSAVDPDGRLIIFIGGLRLTIAINDQIESSYRKGARPGIYHRDKKLQDYWRSGKKGNSFGRNVDMADRFKKQIGDDNDYYLSGSSDWESQPEQRIAEGKAKAQLFVAMYLNGQIKLEKGETIKIVSHSQGGAHSVGFAEELLKYKNPDGSAMFNIEVMYYITPHQPTKFSHISGIRGVQYSHPSDAISSDDPGWLPNGGSDFGRINGITEFDDRDIMFNPTKPGRRGVQISGSNGQIPSTGASGNRGGHNVYDNDFIFNIPRLDPGGVRRREDNPMASKEKKQSSERK